MRISSVWQLSDKFIPVMKWLPFGSALVFRRGITLTERDNRTDQPERRTAGPRGARPRANPKLTMGIAVPAAIAPAPFHVAQQRKAASRKVWDTGTGASNQLMAHRITSRRRIPGARRRWVSLRGLQDFVNELAMRLRHPPRRCVSQRYHLDRAKEHGGTRKKRT